MMMRVVLVCFVLSCALTSGKRIPSVVRGADELRVGTLADHNPGGWNDKNGNCSNSSTGSLERIRCNLNVYEKAVAIASQNGLDLLILLEAYGLSDSPDKNNGWFDRKIDPFVNRNPCTDKTDVQAKSPVLTKLSCLARAYNVSIASNVFTSLENGTNRISEYVFDRRGDILATYDKHVLFPVEEPKTFQPGPFDPTVFSLKNRTLGIVICYEGFYPFLTGHYEQIDSLVRDLHADALVWSVGGSLVSSALELDAYELSKKYKVPVFASEDSEIFRTASVALYDADAKKFSYTDVHLGGDIDGYAADAYVRFADWVE